MADVASPPAPTAAAEPNPREERARAPRKRMLVIVNPYATTVSDRLKNLVVYALQGRYDVEAVDTEAKNHATEIGREAIDGGYDVVVAFGGDGTLNEVANGLAGTDIPVSVLPGGSTNVVCRTLGIPNDVVDATEHLLGAADRWSPRRIDLGVANGRRFVFSCGAGLDAVAARRVDSRPKLKARAGPWFYTYSAVAGFYRDFLTNAVEMKVTSGERSEVGITTICQNSDPFTYFRGIPVRVCEDIAIDNRSLALAVLKRAAQRDMPFVIARLLSNRLRAVDHRHIEHFAGIAEARVESVSSGPDGGQRPFPVQVDGDFIGEHAELDLSVDAAALTVIA